MMAFIKFKGTTNPFHLGIGFRPLLASFHSNIDHHLSMLQKVSNLDDALNLFDEMTQRQPLPSVVQFTQLLDLVTKMNHFSESFLLFKQMCAIGVPVDHYSMSIAIKCCCQLYHTNHGFTVVGYCFKIAIAPNAFVFNALLNGLVREDRVVEAERLFMKLINQNLCEPNVATYNTMIKGLCKFGNNFEAIALLRLMEERGCNPDVFSYSTIIDGLCKGKMIDDAFKLFKEMAFQKGIQPTVITYNCMINGLCILGRWDDAYKMLKEMENENISPTTQPNVSTYNTMINGLCKFVDNITAFALLRRMEERGCNPDVVSYSIIIDNLCKCKMIDDAFKLFKEMVFRKNILPNVITYNCLLHGLCKLGRWADAFNMLKEMDSGNISPTVQPNVHTYTVMIYGLCQEGLLTEAKQLFHMMDERGIPGNNVTYRVLLQGSLKNRQFYDVEMLLQEMERKGYFLNATILSLLRDGIASGSLDRSILKLIDKLMPKDLIDT